MSRGEAAPCSRSPGHNQAKVRPHLALGLLFAIGLVNYIDRVAMSVLQVPVKTELQLSDEQIGLLMGFAFFVPYTLLSIPMARLADRGNRKLVIVLALALWSAMTFFVGLANSFAMLLFLRVGVALGEACCLPTSYSMIANIFPKEKLGRAIAIFGTTFPIGSMIGLVASGQLDAQLGWRQSFFAIGALGLVLVPVVMIGLKEPVRESANQATAPKVKLTEAMLDIWRRKAFRYCILGLGMQSIVSIALLTWAAPFYSRSFNLDLGTVSLLVGFVMAGAGAIGTLGGGLLGDRLARRRPRRLMFLPAVAALVATPFALLQLLTGNLAVSVTAALVCSLLANAYLAPCNALIQRLARHGTQALAAAVGVTGAAILGGGLGPWGAGRLSDNLAELTGSPADGLRYAVAAFMLAGLPAAYFFWLSMRHLEREETSGGVETAG
jgi:predicted MFS family arabinose efflux permease